MRYFLKEHNQISIACLFKGKQEQSFFLQTLLFTAFLVTVLKILTYALASTWSSVSSGWEHGKRKKHLCLAPSPLQFINRRSDVFGEKEILQKTTCLTSHSILAEVIGFSILLNAIRGAGRLYYETCLEIANGYARNGQAPRKFIITVLDFLMQVQRPQRLLVIMRMEKGWTWLNWFFRYFVCFFLGPPIW